MRALKGVLFLTIVAAGSAMAQTTPPPSQPLDAVATLLDSMTGSGFVKIVALFVLISGVGATVVTQSIRHVLFAVPVSMMAAFGPSLIKSILDDSTSNTSSATAQLAAGNSFPGMIFPILLVVGLVPLCYGVFRYFTSEREFSEEDLQSLVREVNEDRRRSAIPSIEELPPTPLPSTSAHPASNSDTETEAVVRNRRKIVL